MATVPGPCGAISDGVIAVGSAGGYISHDTFTAVDGGLLPNLSVGPAGPTGTFAGMGVCYSGAISSPFAGGYGIDTNDLSGLSRPYLPNLSYGAGVPGPGASPFIVNFSQTGYVCARGYVYYESSIISVQQQIHGASAIINSFVLNDKGMYGVLAAMELTDSGVSRVLAAFSDKLIGESRVLYLNEIGDKGTYKAFNSFEVTDFGGYNIEFVSVVLKLAGLAQVLNTVQTRHRNIHRVLIGCNNAGLGIYGRHAAIVNKLTGRYQVSKNFQVSLRGLHGTSTSFTRLGMRGRARQQTSTAAGYVAYVAAGGTPDFTLSPAAFSTTLPFEITLAPPITGVLTYHIVVRARDSYGLESQNQKSFTVTIDTAGNQILANLPTPTGVDAGVDSTADVMVTADYPDYGQSENLADKWRIWLSAGTINTTTDVPTLEVDVDSFRLLAKLSGFSSGTYNLAVGLYRTEDDRLSSIATKVVVVPEAPDEPLAVNGMAVVLDD